MDIQKGIVPFSIESACVTVHTHIDTTTAVKLKMKKDMTITVMITRPQYCFTYIMLCLDDGIVCRVLSNFLYKKRD